MFDILVEWFFEKRLSSVRKRLKNPIFASIRDVGVKYELADFCETNSDFRGNFSVRFEYFFKGFFECRTLLIHLQFEFDCIEKPRCLILNSAAFN